MGEVEVAVGCPHRLRQPIGPHTRFPCPACTAYGPPGWPRLAIAMTVDHGPRLGSAAVEGVEPDVEPILPERYREVMCNLAKAMSAAVQPLVDWKADAVKRVTIGHGPMQVTTERASDAIRVRVEQEMRLRSR